VVEQTLGDGSALGIETLAYSPEESILGTGGGLRRASPLLGGSGPFLVRNSDFLADIDLEAAVETHRASGALATLVLAPPRPGYTEVWVDGDGRIVSFGGLPPADETAVRGRYLFTGLHVVEEEVLDLIPEGRASDIVRDVYVALASARRLASYVHDGFWWEFGNARSYLDGSLELLSLEPAVRRGVAETDPIREIGDSRVAAGAGADFHAGVDLRGGVAIGLASMVTEGCRVEDSVILAESWLGPGCELRRCVIGPGVELPGGTRLENAMVCVDAAPTLPVPEGVGRWNGFLVRPFGGE
jgi:mannose-1-phosphate guanylyltransferase